MTFGSIRALVAALLLAAATSAADERVYLVPTKPGTGANGEECVFVTAGGRRLPEGPFFGGSPSMAGDSFVVLDSATKTWRYYDTKGTALLRDHRFEWAFPFVESRAVARTVGGESFVIFRQDFTQVTYPGRVVRSFSGQRAAFAVGDGELHWGFIDQEGKVVVKPTYDWAGEFAGEYAPVQNAGRWTIIDRNGAAVDSVDAEQAVVSDGMVLYGKEGRREFKKLRGPKLAGDFKEAAAFGDGLAPVKQAGADWQYITADGANAKIGNFAFATSFFVQRAVVATLERGKKRYGLIDTKGRYVVPPRYELLARQSRDTFTFVTPDGRAGLVLLDGRELVAPPVAK